jgi:hypothetical protein
MLDYVEIVIYEKHSSLFIKKREELQQKCFMKSVPVSSKVISFYSWI